MDRLTSSFNNLFQRKLFNLSYRTYLLFILLFALIIRIYGITRELPFILTPDVSCLYQDPKQMILRVFSDQTPNLWNFVIPPVRYLPAFKYILFVGFSMATLLVAVYLQIFQGFPFLSAVGKAALWLKSSGGLIVTGRLVAVIFGLLTIYLIYRLGKELFSREVGLTAALFLAVMPQHVALSQYILVDSSLLFWTVLLALFSCKIASSGKLKYYLAAGITFGALFSTKHSAPFFALFLLHAHFLRIRQEKTGWTKIFWDRRVLYAAGMILVGIFITFPSFFILPDQYAAVFIRTRDKSATSLFAMTTTRELTVYWGYISELIHDWWGHLFTLISFAGGALILFLNNKNNKQAQITVVTPILFFIFMSSYTHKYYRWIGPAYPFFALWAAFLCCWAMGKLGSRFKDDNIRKAVATIGLMILVLKPLSVSIKSSYDINRPDTRLTAFEWVRKNIPEDTIIATYKYHRWALPPLGRYRLVNIPIKKYNINRAMEKDRALPLNAYKEKGVEYFILDGIHKDYHYRQHMIKRFPETAKSFQNFYQEMETNSELVFMLYPKSGNYKGPRIEIYRLRNN